MNGVALHTLAGVLWQIAMFPRSRYRKDQPSAFQRNIGQSLHGGRVVCLVLGVHLLWSGYFSLQCVIFLATSPVKRV